MGRFRASYVRQFIEAEVQSLRQRARPAYGRVVPHCCCIAAHCQVTSAIVATADLLPAANLSGSVPLRVPQARLRNHCLLPIPDTRSCWMRKIASTLSVFISPQSSEHAPSQLQPQAAHQCHGTCATAASICLQLCLSDPHRYVQEDEDGAFMVNLVVHDKWRGQGLGRRMSQFVADLAAKQGAHRLYAEVDSKNVVRFS